ncbi:MAG: PD-(D/E)XK nuclease family transposase, partial [Taibaiella sp.]|nr:PD-(D/E)XK nuclease family transposase [Taibaiella sp.]
NFNKTEAELVSRLDQWLYFIKNLEDFQSIPEIFSNDGIFIRVMERARIAKYDREQQQEYESSLKVYRDLRNVVDSAERKGRKEGKEEGRLEGEANKERYAAERERQKLVDIAIKCKARGMPVEDIADLTGLSIDEINGL